MQFIVRPEDEENVEAQFLIEDGFKVVGVLRENGSNNDFGLTLLRGVLVVEFAEA